MPIHLGLDRVTKQLEHHLPPVTILTGSTVEKNRELAIHLAEHHQVQEGDLLELQNLTADSARESIAFSSYEPHGKLKVIVIHCGVYTDRGFNILLKTLEDPPLRVKFLLLVDKPAVLPRTLRSRVQEYWILGDSLEEPASVASTQTARSLIRAVATADNALFDRIVSSVNANSAEEVRVQVLRLLVDFVGDIPTTTITDLPKNKAMRMIRSLSKVSHVRGRLALRVGLETFLRN